MVRSNWSRKSASKLCKASALFIRWPWKGPQAQRDNLHTRRGICGGRAQTWANRADRSGPACHRHSAERRDVREDHIEHAGGHPLWRSHHPVDRSERRFTRRIRCLRDVELARDARRRSAAGFCCGATAPGLSQRRSSGDRRRPTAQSRKVRDGRIVRQARSLCSYTSGRCPMMLV